MKANRDQELAPFLPSDRAAAMAQGQMLPDRSQGAVLFADITGFVGLTVALAEQHGAREGAERIAQQLNAVFELLILEVHGRGGSVVGFSGDAISCIFAGDNGARATSAALAMRDSLLGYPRLTIGETEFKLRLKSVVTSGEIFRFAVGSEKNQLFDVIAGDAVSRNAEGAQVVLSDQVLVDEATRAALDLSSADRVDTSRAQFFAADVIRGISDCKSEQRPCPTAEQSLPWVLPPLRDRLAKGDSTYLAELRPIATLFLAFSGISFETDPHASAKFARVIALVQGVACKLDGWVIQISTGDKGDYLGVVFGTPVASGDEPTRAIEAALQLRELPQKIDCVDAVRIGLGYGPTWSGAYGASTRRTFGAQGRQVNLAARLMQRAEAGQILLSDRMAQALRGSWRLRPHGELQLKGESRAWPIHEVLGRLKTGRRHAALRAPAPLVGRDAEREVLGQLLAAGDNEFEHRVVILEGEAGIGKSRLLEDLLVLAESADFSVAVGAALPESQDSSHFVWRSILLELAGLEENDWAGLARWIQQQLQHDVQLWRFCGLLNQVAPLALAEDPDLARLSPGARYEFLQRQLLRLTASAAETRPLLMVIEDAHWLDSASWNLLAPILGFSGIRLVLASRPPIGTPAAEYAALCRLAGPGYLRLEPLGEQAIYQLIAQRLGIDTVPESMWTLIRDRAQGNPYFSEEIAYALRDHGVIEIDGRSLRLPRGMDAVMALDLPDTVEGIVQSRIDLLDESEQLTLKVASVIGRVFSFRSLQAIYPGSEAAAILRGQLQRLEALEITPIDSPEPQLAYFFRHIITQEVAYGRMTREQRQPIHRALAEHIETEYPDQAMKTRAGLLAHHWREAGDIGRAMIYLEAVGRQAQHAGSFRAAIAHFQQLLSLQDAHQMPVGVARLCSWHEHLAAAYAALGQVEHTATHAEAAIAMLERPLPNDARGVVRDLLRQSVRQLGHLALRALHLGPAPAADQDTQRMLCRLYTKMAEVCFLRGTPLPHLLANVHRINAADRAGECDESLLALLGFSVMCQILRLTGLKQHYIRRAQRAIASSGGLEQIELTPRRMLDMLSFGDGELDELRERGQRLFADVASLGDHDELMRLIPSYRVFLATLGEHRRALEVSDKLEQILVAADNLSDELDEHQIMLCNQRAMSWTFLGERAKADEQLRRLHAVDLSSVPEHRQLWILYARSRRAMLDHDFDTAMAQARELHQVLPAGRPFASVLLDVYALAADIVLSARETQGETKINRKVVAWSFRPIQCFARSFAIGRPRLQGFEARLLILQGKSARARSLLSRALNSPALASLQHDRARLKLAMARSWPVGSVQREGYAREALDEFETLGAKPDVELAQLLLGRR